MAKISLGATVIPSPKIPFRTAVPAAWVNMYNRCRWAQRRYGHSHDRRRGAHWRRRNHDLAGRIVNSPPRDHHRGRWNRQGWGPHGDFRQERQSYM
jgi:hypothetical protein